MPTVPTICVFCGSSVRHRPAYAEAARRVGATLADAAWASSTAAGGSA